MRGQRAEVCRRHRTVNDSRTQTINGYRYIGQKTGGNDHGEIVGYGDEGFIGGETVNGVTKGDGEGRR